MSARLIPEPGCQSEERSYRLPTDRNPAVGSHWRGALARSRLVRSTRPWGGLATCLMYHRICPDPTGQDRGDKGFAPNLELSVTASAFDAQMAFAARHFNCLSLPDAVAGLARGKLPERSLIVTFDDGYLDNLTLALPVLRRHGVPATVYIATGLRDQSALLWWHELEHLISRVDELSFAWDGHPVHLSTADDRARNRTFEILNARLKQMKPADQVRFMTLLRNGAKAPAGPAELFLDRHQLTQLAADPLVTIGAHTHRHYALSHLDPPQLSHEISRSKVLLETWLNRPVEHLAYPFGGQAHASNREFDAAARLGFVSGVTTRLGHFQHFHKRNLLALPRIGIGYRDCMDRFEWKISGLYSLVRRPRSRLMC